jgi:hypothetical protein
VLFCRRVFDLPIHRLHPAANQSHCPSMLLDLAPNSYFCACIQDNLVFFFQHINTRSRTLKVHTERDGFEVWNIQRSCNHGQKPTLDTSENSFTVYCLWE